MTGGFKFSKSAEQRKHYKIQISWQYQEDNTTQPIHYNLYQKKKNTLQLVRKQNKTKLKQPTISGQQIICNLISSLCTGNQLQWKHITISQILTHQTIGYCSPLKQTDTNKNTCIAATNSVKPRNPCLFESVIAQTLVKEHQLSQHLYEETKASRTETEVDLRQ